MKSLLAPLLISIAALAATVAPGSPVLSEARAQGAAEARVNLHIEGMHCATCPITVRTVLRRLDGVADVTVSVSDKRARVVYDPQRVTPERMARAVTDAGYPTSVERGSNP
jgi:mercuric ion binding protein